MNKSFDEIVRKNNLPITLLFMENVATENSKPHISISISYKQGEKLIGHDFYKHISTY